MTRVQPRVLIGLDHLFGQIVYPQDVTAMDVLREVKMKVSLQEVDQAFDSLIKEAKSREELATWALTLQFAEDEGELEYDPPDEEDKIWDGISYLV